MGGLLEGPKGMLPRSQIIGGGAAPLAPSSYAYEHNDTIPYLKIVKGMNQAPRKLAADQVSNLEPLGPESVD